jgi:hypothetical protein
MTISGDLLRQRLAWDYKVAKAMVASSSLIDVQAFASQQDLRRRKRPIRQVQQAGSAGYYLVHYGVKSLIGPGRYHTGFDVEFDLMSKKSYPAATAHDRISAGGITAMCVSQPMPWSPHFLDGVGTICLGSVWRGAKHTLLAHVIIHVARLLNWDEAIPPTYHGWNPRAVFWWKRHLNSRPITPGLKYPVLPHDITHGLPASTVNLQILKVVTPRSAACLFKPRDDGFLQI